MKTSYSTSLILVWRVAEFEARHAKASSIAPPHLLLGLCKVVDLDLPELLPKDSVDRNEILEELLREVRKLRTVFRASGVDAKTLRRRLRGVATKERFSIGESSRLRRTPSAREIFSEAEQLAQIGDNTVYPIHLLYTTLMARDADRDALFKELKIDQRRLLELVKGEVLSRIGKPASMKSNSKNRWN